MWLSAKSVKLRKFTVVADSFPFVFGLKTVLLFTLHRQSFKTERYELETNINNN